MDELFVRCAHHVLPGVVGVAVGSMMTGVVLSSSLVRVVKSNKMDTPG
jgi:hypothetical protein